MIATSEPGNSRLTAVLMAAIALILVYLLVFHWFMLRHAAYAEELDGLEEQLVRFQSIAAKREPMEAQLKLIRESREDANLFLDEADFNEAAAALSDRLGQMVRTQAQDSCQIVSRQPVKARTQERYERVTVNVRMRCEVEDFLKILHRLESVVPMVLVGDLNVIKPRAHRARRGRGEEIPSSVLDIRFNMSGYLR